MHGLQSESVLLYVLYKWKFGLFSQNRRISDKMITSDMQNMINYFCYYSGKTSKINSFDKRMREFIVLNKFSLYQIETEN